MAATPEIETIYRSVHERLDQHLRTLDEGALGTPVPACPGWTVRDVVAHLVSVADDFLAGRITSVPTSEQTAEQVARAADLSIGELLDQWAPLVPRAAEAAASFDVWPMALDVTTHELDIRGALGDRSQQSAAEVAMLVPLLLGMLDVGRPLRVATETASYGDEDADLSLRTTDFEAFRWRFGRRSRDQLEAMEWSSPPGDEVLGALCIFGPSDDDIVE